MVTSRTGTSIVPFGFAARGQYQTDTDSGLMLVGHRLYDPSVGRFITQDPARAGNNWYAYCDNNPLSRLDPLGLDFLGIPTGTWIGAGVTFAIAATGGTGVAAIGLGMAAGSAWSYYHDGNDIGTALAQGGEGALGGYAGFQAFQTLRIGSALAFATAEAQRESAGGGIPIYRAPTQGEYQRIQATGAFDNLIHVTPDLAYAQAYADRYGTPVFTTSVSKSAFDAVHNPNWSWFDQGSIVSEKGWVMQPDPHLHGEFYTGWGPLTK